MNIRLRLGLAGSALLLAALAGCSTSSPAPATTTEPSASAAPAPAASADVGVADSSLGEIIVDGTGMTAYVFDKDVADSGTSACTGQCLVNWPPITAGSATPTVNGITGKIGTITDAAGDLQITVNGLPIYLFAQDSAPGDVTGQGVGDVWWALNPAGDKIATPSG